jgi:Phospholipase_D-nuclease N-terminal
MFAFFHIFGFLFMLLLAPLVLLAFVFWIWMLIHALTNRGLSDGEKVAWVLVVLFLHFLGALIYFVVGRPRQLARA